MRPVVILHSSPAICLGSGCVACHLAVMSGNWQRVSSSDTSVCCSNPPSGRWRDRDSEQRTQVHSHASQTLSDSLCFCFFIRVPKLPHTFFFFGPKMTQGHPWLFFFSFFPGVYEKSCGTVSGCGLELILVVITAELHFFFLFPPQNHAPSDLYLMTKNPEDSPNTPDVLEIEFSKGICVCVCVFVLPHQPAPWWESDLQLCCDIDQSSVLLASVRPLWHSFSSEYTPNIKTWVLMSVIGCGMFSAERKNGQWKWGSADTRERIFNTLQQSCTGSGWSIVSTLPLSLSSGSGSGSGSWPKTLHLWLQLLP